MKFFRLECASYSSPFNKFGNINSYACLSEEDEARFFDKNVPDDTKLTLYVITKNCSTDDEKSDPYVGALKDSYPTETKETQSYPKALIYQVHKLYKIDKERCDSYYSSVTEKNFKDSGLANIIYYDYKDQLQACENNHADILLPPKNISMVSSALKELNLEEYKEAFNHGAIYRMKSMDTSELKTDPRQMHDFMFRREFAIYIPDSELFNDSKQVSKIRIHGKDIALDDLESLIKTEKDIRPDPRFWRKTEDKPKNLYSGYLANQIRTRYAMFERPRNGLSNVIIDSFAPRCLINGQFTQVGSINALQPTKTMVAISPWFSKLFGVKQVPAEQLCRILGYDQKTLKGLINSVKIKQYDMMFIGYGGTNVNTIHWLNQIMEFTNSINLFENVHVYEPEDAEFSNLIRFPKNPLDCTEFTQPNQTQEQSTKSVNHQAHQRKASKLDLIGSDLNRLTKRDFTLRKDFYKVRANQSHSGIFHKTTPVLDENKKIKTDEQGNRKFETQVASPNKVIYGAPGLRTREELSKYGHFISATHSDAGCRLDLNPAQDLNLQVESYGVIQLSSFFMNQLRMAIGLLETLASDDLDLMEKDKELLAYSFDGKRKMKTDREYNFQLEHSGNIATEAEVAMNTGNTQPPVQFN